MPTHSEDRQARFYVYVVRINRQTRYVGKGSGKRAQVHLTHSHNETLASLVAAANAGGESVRTRIIRSGLSEREAFRLERRAIAKWKAGLTNKSMGAFTPEEHAAMQASAALRRLKDEDQVRREGAWNGVSVERRLEFLARIRAEFEHMAAAA